MPRTKEEVAGELVWRYVEYIREETQAGRAAAFSRDELEQLLQALDTASRVPEALDGEPSAAVVTGARECLHTALSVSPSLPAYPMPNDPAPAAPAVPFRRRLRAWALPAAVAAVLVLGAALATVPLWHHVRTVVRRVPVPTTPDVQPISERRSRALIPLLVNNALDRQDERNLMWHMLVCPRCFERYVQERNERTLHAAAPEELALEGPPVPASWRQGP